MGIFGDLDVASAADDPFKVEDGTYGATVTDFKAGETKKGDKFGLTIQYTINDGGPMDNRKVTEWKQIPRPVDPKNPTAEEATAASYLKMRLHDLGIPEDRMNTVEPDDVMGTDVIITVKNNEKTGYTNITKVVTKSSSEGFTSFGSDNPFAGNL